MPRNGELVGLCDRLAGAGFALVLLVTTLGCGTNPPRLAAGAPESAALNPDSDKSSPDYTWAEILYFESALSEEARGELTQAVERLDPQRGATPEEVAAISRHGLGAVASACRLLEVEEDFLELTGVRILAECAGPRVFSVIARIHERRLSRGRPSLAEWGLIEIDADRSIEWLIDRIERGDARGLDSMLSSLRSRKLELERVAQKLLRHAPRHQGRLVAQGHAVGILKGIKTLESDSIRALFEVLERQARGSRLERDLQGSALEHLIRRVKTQGDLVRKLAGDSLLLCLRDLEIDCQLHGDLLVGSAVRLEDVHLYLSRLILRDFSMELYGVDLLSQTTGKWEPAACERLKQRRELFETHLARSEQ